VRTVVEKGSEVPGEGYVQLDPGEIPVIFLTAVTLDDEGLMARSISIGSSAKGTSITAEG
jgi:hypothetical protein